jgi:hypothetical protein
MTSTRMRTSGAVFSLSAAGLISMAGLLGLAPVAHADAADNQFLAMLKKDDINHASASAAIAAGKKVCEYLDTGMNLTNVEQDVENSSGLPDYDTGFFVGAAIKAYCPQFMPAVPKQDVPQPAGNPGAPPPPQA